MSRLWMAVLCCLPMLAGAAAIEVDRFEDPARQARYERLLQELRCLVCQNQSLADSDADLAKDLRREVYQLLREGKSEQEAVGFLVDRYGDFVRYRPPLKPSTVLLWGTPALLLLLGLYMARRQIAARARPAAAAPLTDSERRRLRELLERHPDNKA